MDGTPSAGGAEQLLAQCNAGNGQLAVGSRPLLGQQKCLTLQYDGRQTDLLATAAANPTVP
eukprot:CAMPEP_0174292764 /NCGR_PEP_ID=MMETSP0809-20121228/36460_1 /TAXON_ID=73025 ORGANISM="Eutreptiella gymnastica-like, Strain CCMP1594" /NCGR_SAMPLE_ID=MMETSP0809 /ASSEMBLY_ACC=CAM_ASM_000658 /LENGTH=60 /DNA_ID=CAMNT_0015393049 /DNA_START=1692 /DNA_END=1874 /DNA_ORIENTATION=-